MKYKKYSYILILLLILVVGTSKIYAIEKNVNINTELKYIEDSKQKNINIVQVNNNYQSNEEICKELFGDKDEPDSIRNFVDEILKYPKIIIPILVIVLGTLDLAKAVMAAKEDEMRKAQSTFIKRVLVGVVIFFVPMILDIIMYFIDLVLGYTTCGI